jgi:hypothetical protein
LLKSWATLPVSWPSASSFCGSVSIRGKLQIGV